MTNVLFQGFFFSFLFLFPQEFLCEREVRTG